MLTLALTWQLTYYAPEQPPALLGLAPVGADCSSGATVVRLRGRNLAPTSRLRCGFGELGESVANFSGASRAAPPTSEAAVECAVPATALLGDVRVRVSNDGGARWSEPSAQRFTCHDARRPPELLSVLPETVDQAAAAAAAANGSRAAPLELRARNMRRGVPLRCRLGAGGELQQLAGWALPPETDATLESVTLASPQQTVGRATCPLPDTAALAPAAFGRIGLEISADAGRSWSAPVAIALFASDLPPSLLGLTPSSLAIAGPSVALPPRSSSNGGDGDGGGGGGSSRIYYYDPPPPPDRARVGYQAHHLHLSAANVAAAGSSCHLVCNSSQRSLPGGELCEAPFAATLLAAPFGAPAQVACTVRVPPWLGELQLELRGPAPQPASNATTLALYDPATPPTVAALTAPSAAQLHLAAISAAAAMGPPRLLAVEMTACNLPHAPASAAAADGMAPPPHHTQGSDGGDVAAALEPQLVCGLFSARDTRRFPSPFHTATATVLLAPPAVAADPPAPVPAARASLTRQEALFPPDGRSSASSAAARSPCFVYRGGESHPRRTSAESWLEEDVPPTEDGSCPYGSIARPPLPPPPPPPPPPSCLGLVRCSLPVGSAALFPHDPAAGPAQLEVRLSHDGGIRWSGVGGGGALAVWRVEQLAPLSGPSSGNTSVLLTGALLPPCATGCACRFGDEIVPATRVADTAAGAAGVRCLSPAVLAPAAGGGGHVLPRSVAVAWAADGEHFFEAHSVQTLGLALAATPPPGHQT